MTCNHLNPKTWIGWKERAEVQQITPTYCPGCKKFMGNVLPPGDKKKGGNKK